MTLEIQSGHISETLFNSLVSEGISIMSEKIQKRSRGCEIYRAF